MKLPPRSDNFLLAQRWMANHVRANRFCSRQSPLFGPRKSVRVATVLELSERNDFPEMFLFLQIDDRLVSVDY